MTRVASESPPFSRLDVTVANAPRKLDLRSVLPLAVRPSLFGASAAARALLGARSKPVIVVDSAENIFRRDIDGNDASWLLFVLIEASKHAECVLLFSDEASHRARLARCVVVTRDVSVSLVPSFL